MQHRPVSFVYVSWPVLNAFGVSCLVRSSGVLHVLLLVVLFPANLVALQRNWEGACIKISSNLGMSSMSVFESLPSKVSGFADSGGRVACSWVTSGGGGYRYSIHG